MLRHELGSLDRVARAVRLGLYVRAAEDFVDYPAVADGASEPFDALCDGAHARLVIGVANLPRGMPVELEVIVALAAGDDGAPAASWPRREC